MEDVFELEVKLEELGIRSGKQLFILLVIVEPQQRIGEVEEVGRLLHRSLKVHCVTNAIIPRVVISDGILLCRDEDILQRHVEGLIEIEDGIKPFRGVLHLVVGDREGREPMAPRAGGLESRR